MYPLRGPCAHVTISLGGVPGSKIAGSQGSHILPLIDTSRWPSRTAVPADTPTSILTGVCHVPGECASAKLGAKPRKRKTRDLESKDSSPGKWGKEFPECVAGLGWSRRIGGCGKEDARKLIVDPLHLSGLKILY